MRTELWTVITMLSPLVLLAASAGAQEKQLRQLRLNVFRIDAATVAARARGLFAAEGLDVRITATPNSTEQMRGISKGTFDIASSAFDNVLAWSGKEGADIVAIAQVSDRTVLPIFVRPEIRDWSDLKGKKLAVDAVDTAFALVLRRVLLAHGLDMNRGDYALVPVGATGHRLESMTKGETFAAILNAPFDQKALEAGLRRIGDSKDVLPDYPNTIFAVNQEWGKKNREILVAFLRAWLAGMRWVKDPANQEEAIKLVGADLKLNPKAAAGSVNELSTTGSLNLPGLESVLSLRTQFGFKLLKRNSLASYYDESYYRVATGK
ncbi:MAG: ABC transporter substrate-binding protein [Deltaproteobacteria bacterium]|nr:ABC transporter substrate-binding protein [Deltaproteobacteria bacterium]